jgi:hypothetical protein
MYIMIYASRACEARGIPSFRQIKLRWRYVMKRTNLSLGAHALLRSHTMPTDFQNVPVFRINSRVIANDYFGLHMTKQAMAEFSDSTDHDICAGHRHLIHKHYMDHNSHNFRLTRGNCFWDLLEIVAAYYSHIDCGVFLASGLFPVGLPELNPDDYKTIFVHMKDSDYQLGKPKTAIKVSKYLAKYSNMPDYVISEFMGFYLDKTDPARARGKYTFHVESSGKAISDIYKCDRVPSDGATHYKDINLSCMRHKTSHFNTTYHPTRAYGSGDFQIAALKTLDGKLAARVIMTADLRRAAPIYSASQSAGDILRDLCRDRFQVDPADLDDSLHGYKLKAIESGLGGFLCPYLDSGESVTYDGDNLRIDKRGDWTPDTDGIVGEDDYDDDSVCCDACGDRVDIDDSYSSESGNCYCQDCYESRFTRCDECEGETDNDETTYIESEDITVCRCCRRREFTQSDYSSDWFRNDNVITLIYITCGESDYEIGESELDRLETVTDHETGELMRADYAVECVGGVYLHQDSTMLIEVGNDYFAEGTLAYAECMILQGRNESGPELTPRCDQTPDMLQSADLELATLLDSDWVPVPDHVPDYGLAAE